LRDHHEPPWRLYTILTMILPRVKKRTITIPMKNNNYSFDLLSSIEMSPSQKDFEHFITRAEE
jgi:hypothetical protein